MHFLPGTWYLVNFWILDDPGASCGSNPDPNCGTFPEASVRPLSYAQSGFSPLLCRKKTARRTLSTQEGGSLSTARGLRQTKFTFPGFNDSISRVVDEGLGCSKLINTASRGIDLVDLSQ